MNDEERRPDPDDILWELNNGQENGPGRLKIFFGYAAGVGKTYAMLDEARERHRAGTDVLVGYIEPHTRPETMQLLEGLPALAPKIVPYRNIQLKEFDLDEALKRHPELILVDELAHTNATGVRNKKRYQDIEELLNAGIDVYTTVNVQHMESLNDVVEGITKVHVQETVPDFLFDRAEKLKLIDIEPDELLRRFEDGKIYRPERAETAMRNFFTLENLKLLREIAMRRAADRISSDNQSERGVLHKMASTKLLAAIGPSPTSEKCIRWTARAAEAFHAHWTCVYVETASGDALTKAQEKTLRAHMDLAERLGAEVVTLTGHDIAGAISEYARLSGITNIVIGKSRNRKTIRSLFETDIEDKLIALLPGVEVHIIPGSAGDRPYVRPEEKLRGGVSFSLADTGKTLGLLILATILSFGLRGLQIADQNVIMVYILSVLVISRVTAGYFYGVIASVVSVLAFNFFFVEPYFTFTAIQPAYPVTFLVMLLIALITSALTVRIKTQARQAAQREHRTEVLYEINKKLLATRGAENIARLINSYIVNLFDRSVIFYTADPETGAQGVFLQSPKEGDAAFMHSADERAVAHWVFVNGKRAGAGTDTLMGAAAFYMPVISQGKVLAVWGISCISGTPGHATRQFLRMIASQAALSLERQRLSDEQRGIVVESEKEKTRSTLLRAISHDLRTPLSGILGSAAALHESGPGLDESTRDRLTQSIQEEAQWLIRMVENLLSVTKLSGETSDVKMRPEAAEEVVAEAVGRIEKRFPNRRVDVSVPRELLEVPMDGTLVMQVLINLIENALKYSLEQTKVEVRLEKSGDFAKFSVLDSGRGIPPEELPRLFESGAAGHGKSPDSQRGMGIGLHICNTIVKAHHGVLEARNRPEGGAEFSFTLPLKE